MKLSDILYSMKPLFDLKMLDNVRSKTKLPFECEWCGDTFEIEAKFVKSKIKRQINEFRFCNRKCVALAKNKRVKKQCTHCNKVLVVKQSELRKSKSGNSFCSKNCTAVYNNTHKATGNRRSKLEIWLEQKLTNAYDFDIQFNHKTVINSELDIYIPLLKLAFELNGIFHYEPIYGIDKLSSIQKNDDAKLALCRELDIELFVINTSAQKRFSEETSKQYLNLIVSIIERKLYAAGPI